ncbi:MAG: tyrosine--tRNA ligase [Bacilli bacterium]
MDILKELSWRGLINDMTDEAGLREVLAKESVSLYCGFDPTGDSLHIGHLLPVLMLKRFQMAGHKPVPLVGGATGMIGDPSGKKAERTLNTVDTVKYFSESIRSQLVPFLSYEGENAARVVNNYDWTGELDVITFLRDVGKNFGLNYMLAKDSVSSRLETGISFTEFSYMILQSYDFLRLYQDHGVRLQIGGSDQWGNITAGLELIRKTEENAKAFGLTVPLVTKADGTKFGKTEGGAIWLDPEKTTPYEFYQFWVNTDDRDVVKYLKYFTFLDEATIATLEEAVETAAHERRAQRALAEEVTRLVHGEAALASALRITEALFNGDIAALTADEIASSFKDVPSHVMTEESMPLVDLLVESKVSPSKRQAREDVTNGAVYLNGERETSLDTVVDAARFIDGRFLVVRRGKKKYTLVKREG